MHKVKKEPLACSECQAVVERRSNRQRFCSTTCRGRAAWRQKRSQEGTLEKQREQAREWRAANRERHRAYSRKWQADNPERARERKAAWYLANKARTGARGRQWREDNRDHYRELSREDSRKRYLRRDQDAYVYSLILRGDSCSYCGEQGGAVDHIEPLSGGGRNEWENLTATCIPCNSSKRSKPLLLWMVTR